MNPLEMKRKQIEICSNVIGLAALLAFGGWLGDNGVAYLAVAAECFLLTWNLVGRGFADVLGRNLRGKAARGQRKNADKIRKIAMGAEAAVGLLGSLLLCLLAEPAAVKVFRVSHSAVLIMLIAPAVFLRALSGVLLGYFQGEGTEMPAVAASVARQVCVLLFGLLFCSLFRGYGRKVSALLWQEDFAAMYSGMGIALGVTAAEAAVLLFLFLVYRGSRGEERQKGGSMRIADNFGSLARGLYGSLLPSAVTGTLRVLPLLLGLFFYRGACGTAADLEQYGVFYGKYLTLCGIAIAPVYALLLESCSKVSAYLRRDEERYARNYFWGGLHVGIAHALFWTMLFTVLAPQIAGVFCQNDASGAARMLGYGSALILFAVLGAYFSELLRQMGGRYLLMGILALYNVFFALSAAMMLNAGNLGIMALVDAGLLTELAYAGVTGVLVCLRIRCGIDWLQGVVIPAASACVTGLALLLASKAITPHLGNLATVLIGLVGAAALYWGGLIALRNFRGHEIGYLPGGKLVQLFSRWFRIS